MGVLFGKLQVTPAYAAIRNECVTVPIDQHREQLGLSVYTEDGEPIPCEGLGIRDWADGELSEVEVEMLGVPYPPYEALFPGHARDYQTLFGD